jgi:hypothetical protein
MFGICSANRLRVATTSVAHRLNSRTFLKSRGRNGHAEQAVSLQQISEVPKMQEDSELPEHPNPDLRPDPAEP